MQFARGHTGGFQQFAIKFCLDRKDYELEEALYAQPDLRQVLPVLIDARHQSDPSSSVTAKSKHGYVFPPFLVLERGMALSECASPTDHSVAMAISLACSAKPGGHSAKLNL
jgi:hypothetical protein